MSATRVRKIRKAFWVYECEPCGVFETSPDRFRAIEHQQRHEREFTHGGNMAIAAVGKFVEAFTKAFGVIR